MNVRYLENLEEGDGHSERKIETLGEFLDSHKYSQKFRECYLVCSVNPNFPGSL